MEVDTTKQSITVNRLVCTKKELVTIEGDMIVPDVKPDILSTIDTTGNVCIYKKEVMDGKVRFDGSVDLNIIYLADSDKDITRGLISILDFTKIIDVDNCQSGMDLKNSIIIKNIECKVLNGRKISAKVLLEINIEIYSNEDISILKQINNLEGIQTLNSNIQINNLLGTGNCKASAKDTIILPEDEVLSEILKTQIKVINSEIKVSYNKILLKADINVKIMYLTENGEIKIVSSNIPVMGFIDINDVSENNILTSNYEIKNIIIKPNSKEQHSIYVEIEFEIRCDASDSIDLELIQDMYCPSKEVYFKQKEISTTTNKQVSKNICNIREKISLPEISSNKIYDVEIIPNINNTNVLNEKIVYEGDLKLTFVFSSNSDTKIDTKIYMLPFTFTINNNEVNSKKVINTNVYSINDEFIVTSEGMIDCKIDMCFDLEMYNNTIINIIDEITVENSEENNSSMIIYIVKQNDTLWDIAKKYKTTIEELSNINKLDNSNKLNIGQKLFIPRYSISKI